MRLLVVDDDTLVYEMAKRWLGEHELSYTSSPAEAAEMMRDSDYDLVLCDVRIPRYDDGEAAAMLSRSFPETAVIRISADETQGIEKEKGSIREAVREISRALDDRARSDLKHAVDLLRNAHGGRDDD